MIEIGYTTLNGDDTVTGTYNSPVDANTALEALNITLRSRDDIYTLFIQADHGEGMVKYGFVDPLEA